VQKSGSEDKVRNISQMLLHFRPQHIRASALSHYTLPPILTLNDPRVWNFIAKTGTYPCSWP